MYDILITEHYPSIYQQDIPRDGTVEIYLDKQIDTSSVKSNNIIVTDYLYRPVKGTVGYKYTNEGTPSGVANILTFTPDTFLDPETTYIVTVPKYPDSVRGVDDSYIQNSYTYRFDTGISTIDSSEPTYLEQIQMDLDAAIAREDWCEAGRLQSIIDGESNDCAIFIPSGTIDLPEQLIVTSHYPAHMESDIPLEELRFIKLTFNDIMPTDGIDYSAYINVTTKNVLE
jgi:hypothetical protein